MTYYAWYKGKMIAKGSSSIRVRKVLFDIMVGKRFQDAYLTTDSAGMSFYEHVFTDQHGWVWCRQEKDAKGKKSAWDGQPREVSDLGERVGTYPYKFPKNDYVTTYTNGRKSTKRY